MSWGPATRRRAEAFDALVEGVATRTPRDTRDEDLLALVGALRAVPDVSARPEFVADLRQRLMAEAVTALAPVDLAKLRLPERRPARERRLAALAGGIAIVGATTSVTVASQSAIPGDTLYPVKRVLESAHAGIAFSEADKGSLVLANASDRLDEVEELTARGDFGDDLRIADTLGAFSDEATHGSDLLLADYADTGRKSSVAAVRDFASSSLDRLAELEPAVPGDAHDDLLRAAEVLQTIDSEAAQRCPDCGGTPIESVPPTLASGEVITIPTLPTAEAASAAHRDPVHRGPNQHDTDLPDVDSGQLPPGSVSDPSDGSTTDAVPSLGDTGTVRTSDPLRALTDSLTGGGSSDSPLAGVGATVGGVRDGAGDTVDDTVGDVEGLLNGVVDPVTGDLASPGS